jgi:glycolate oxidase iron-sulfur subunit
MTTCPSSVHYMHLVDHARAHIEQTYARPLSERFLRGALAFILARPKLFRLALRGAALARPFAKALPGRLRGLVAMAPKRLPAPSLADRPQVFPSQGARKMRVALLSGCAQTVLDTRINEATIRLLTRHGVEVVVARGAGCCGALTHHLGKTRESRAFAARNIEAWSREIEAGGLDAVVINTSGCGVIVKDYGFMFQDDARLAGKAAHISAIARDVSEILAQIDFAPTGTTPPLRVAYHAACSLQHGQKIVEPPKALLGRAGFTVREPAESHLCCGSAGTYNILLPETAAALRPRKVANLERLKPDVIAAGNIGCLTQIASATAIPVVHTVELLDWASGGPAPAGLG